jgi:hypothetical protein
MSTAELSATGCAWLNYILAQAHLGPALAEAEDAGVLPLVAAIAIVHLGEKYS